MRWTMSGIEQLEGGYSRHRKREKHRNMKVLENCKSCVDTQVE